MVTAGGSPPHPRELRRRSAPGPGADPGDRRRPDGDADLQLPDERIRGQRLERGQGLRSATAIAGGRSYRRRGAAGFTGGSGDTIHNYSRPCFFGPGSALRNRRRGEPLLFSASFTRKRSLPSGRPVRSCSRRLSQSLHPSAAAETPSSPPRAPAAA